MSRIDPRSTFSLVFPDRPDPEHPGKYLCRFCGKPAKPPKRYYCSDECYWNCQRAVSWWFARDSVFKRDGGKCVKCGAQLHDNFNWDCHHVIPVNKLRRLARDVIYRNPECSHMSEDEKNHAWAVVYTLLILDINNLITLCPKCHKKEHSRKKRLNQRELGEYL